MAIEETQNYMFSQKTFNLLREFSNNYDHPEKIKESLGDNFQQYAAKPFELFCVKVAKALSPHFSICCI